MRQAALFGALEEPVSLVNDHGDVIFYPAFLDFEQGDALVTELLAETRFAADSRLMYGKRVAVPRETAGRGDRMSQPWTPLLLVVRERLEALLATGFDYVFVNRYRDGRDSVAWHGDHEGTGKVVASLSLGATREFDLRPQARERSPSAHDRARSRPRRPRRHARRNAALLGASRAQGSARARSARQFNVSTAPRPVTQPLSATRSSSRNSAIPSASFASRRSQSRTVAL